MVQKALMLTDIGKMREENQDAVDFHQFDEDNWFLAVADGMGGYAGGSVASQTVVKNLIKEIKSLDVEQIKEKPQLFMRKAINTANSAVNIKARKQQELKDMGSTCVCCFVTHGVVYTAHVGDSRAYLLREGEISLITEDHTVVQDLVRAGYVSPADAVYHPSSGILTKCLGQMEIAEPEFAEPFNLQEGDRLLLCSDGLSGMLDDDEIGEIVFHEGIDNAIRFLVEMANEAGGFDNITVLLYAYGDFKGDPRSWPIRVGRPFYEDAPPEQPDEPTVPFKLKSKKEGKLRDTLILQAIDHKKQNKKESKRLLPIIAAVLILLFGLLFWYFGGVGI